MVSPAGGPGSRGRDLVAGPGGWTGGSGGTADTVAAMPSDLEGTTDVEVAARYAGPPGMGHGGYVAGLFATGGPEPVQVTLRRPTPLDHTLQLVTTDTGRALRDGDAVIAESTVATLDLDVPPPPERSLLADAEASSPSHYGSHGVHPTCFGCGLHREGDDGLRIAAGPVPGGDQVAARWTPHVSHRDAQDPALVDPAFVVAALDCAGAFAFICTEQSAGLLGRITFAQYRPVPADADLVVTGWQIGTDGRKMLAGTAVFGEGDELLAAAQATWFPFG